MTCWIGYIPSKSDFGGIIVDEFIDGFVVIVSNDGIKRRGPAAIFTPEEYSGKIVLRKIHDDDIIGGNRLGTGFGQRYKKQADGRWLKVEG